MSRDLISLDEASWRLEENDISGAQFAQLLCKHEESLLIGLHPGHVVRDPVDLSRTTNLRVAPGNEVIADGIALADVKLHWSQLVEALKKRGHEVRMPLRVNPEVLRRSREPDPWRRLLGDPRPPVPFRLPNPSPQRPSRLASPEWFAAAVLTAAVPFSGNPPRARRGPKSQKRVLTAAAIRKALEEGTLTVDTLRAMREKQLAARYGVTRDTVRKAKNDALLSFVGNSTSTNDN